MQKSYTMALAFGALFIMRMPCGATTPVLSAIYNFPAGSEGAFPEAGLVVNNGNLFGTTYSGGSGWGTVFELVAPSQSGGAWAIHPLYSFSGGSDGANPRAGVIFSSHGLIYGTTEQGGAYGYGTVFSLTPVGGGKWTQAVIYSFTGQGGDGANPEAGLILSPKGLLYGTTSEGGSAGYGTVFSLTPSSGGAWTEKVLYSFAGAPTGCGTGGAPACDGANPIGTLNLSSSGVLYGTTYSGTAVTGGPLWGTVFQLVQVSGVWTESVLYSFLGAPSGADEGNACGTTGQPACDGGAPASNVVINKTTGALYGTTTYGGNPNGCPLGGYVQGCGAVFQLMPPVAPSTTWTESLIYVFAGSPKDGSLPSYNLAYPSSGGPIYGTTFFGGSSSEVCFQASYSGCGTVYILQPPVAPSTTWTKSPFGIFNGDNGAGPNGVALNPTSAVLYGTAYSGGLAGGYGTVFEVVY